MGIFKSSTQTDLLLFSTHSLFVQIFYKDKKHVLCFALDVAELKLHGDLRAHVRRVNANKDVIKTYK